LRGENRPDLGIGALRREVASRASVIQRRAGVRKAARVGGRALLALALIFALLVALPPYAWPIRGRITSGFFFRHKPDSSALFAIEVHHGLDIAAATGTQVHACAPGLVIEAGSSSSLGNYVRIRHPFGIVSTYGHLSRIDVPKGRIIIMRNLSSIGAVGSTGRSTGSHLHFAMQAGKTLLPPRPFLVFHSIRRAAIGF
jgi:murein DD-endopeptidase MepM/ murein hydrolase activator NlpD